MQRLLALQPFGGWPGFVVSDVSHQDAANVTGVLRTMPRSAQVDNEYVPPLAELAVQMFCRKQSCASGSYVTGQAEGEATHAPAEYIRFMARDQNNESLVTVVKASELLAASTARSSEWLNGKIVLIGGTFEGSPDLVATHIRCAARCCGACRRRAHAFDTGALPRSNEVPVRRPRVDDGIVAGAVCRSHQGTQVASVGRARSLCTTCLHHEFRSV